MEENKKEWTDEQRAAIDLHGRDLLVSAGAGSGKTSVMSERIIERICDEKDPCDIEDMLIVTFTVKATGELSERISKGLRLRAEETRDPRIKKAMSRIGSANIMTINGFCYSVVRRGFAALGLPASVRVADQTEDDLILTEVMEETLEAFYRDSARFGIDDFAAFAENFINDRDDKLGSVFIDISSSHLIADILHNCKKTLCNSHISIKKKKLRAQCNCESFIPICKTMEFTNTEEQMR